jgi:hypothetical protein
MANTSIWLYTGKLVDLANIESYDFVHQDFTHALSIINRYTGNTIWPYSVGQHTWLGATSEEVASAGLSRAFFLHDFSEVLFNDLPSPLKRMVPEYCALETAAQRHIFNVFDEPWENMEKIHSFDKRMCQNEMAVLFSPGKDIGLEPMKGVEIVPINWDIVEVNLNMLARDLGVK